MTSKGARQGSNLGSFRQHQRSSRPVGRYPLVDFAAHYQKGFRNHIVAIADVPALVDSFQHFGCYATYFFYSDDLLSYMSAQQGSPSVSGFAGKVWAPYLPIDLDHPEMTPALEAVRQLRKILLGRWQIDPKALQVYFSGAKGFHLMIDGRLFGRVAPAKGLPAIFDSLRRHLAQELPEPLRQTVDLTIKDRVRLLRLPNTIHEKSKLYKIFLDGPELDELNPDEIRVLAGQPRALTSTDSSGFISRLEVTANAAAAALFHRVQRQVNRFTRKPFAYKFHRPDSLTQIQFPCAGAQAIWESHIAAGLRNNCAIRLASELRLLGLSSEETQKKLVEWNERNDIELSAEELQSVVRSAYQHRFPYRYSCRDEILRRFCPLQNAEACRRFVATASISAPLRE